MNILAIILFVSIVSTYCTACFRRRQPDSISSDSLIIGVPIDKTPSSQLKFTAGDIIGCKIDNVKSHIFLALNSSDVIYVVGVYEEHRKDETRLQMKPFEFISYVYETCDVVTRFYDNKYAADCKGVPYPAYEVVRRARKSYQDLLTPLFYLRDFTKYDQWTCNSEHWVSAWRYGASWTIQTQTPDLLGSNYRGDDCKAPGLQKCNV